MTCPTCTPWCATTEAQLANRQRNMKPGGQPYPCPQCGGTDWATSREMIKPVEPRRMRLKKWLTSFQAIRVMNIIIAIITLNLALTTESRWALVQAFLCGASFSAACYMTSFIKLKTSFDQVVVSFREMSALNAALIENRVKMHVARIEPEDDAHRWHRGCTERGGV